MDLDALHRKWKIEGQARRQERLELKNQDYEKLGELSEEEKKLTVGEIKGIIRQRKYQQWVEKMKRQNVPLKKCDVCQELTTDAHKCMGTRWQVVQHKGVAPIKKEIIITQGKGGDIRVKQQQLIDQDRLNAEYEEIAALKKRLDERSEQISKAIETSIRKDQGEPLEETADVGEAPPASLKPQEPDAIMHDPTSVANAISVPKTYKIMNGALSPQCS